MANNQNILVFIFMIKLKQEFHYSATNIVIILPTGWQVMIQTINSLTEGGIVFSPSFTLELSCIDFTQALVKNYFFFKTETESNQFRGFFGTDKIRRKDQINFLCLRRQVFLYSFNRFFNFYLTLIGQMIRRQEIRTN